MDGTHVSNEDKLRDYLKRVVADLQQTRQQLDQATAADREPIAIVGMSCRFPGDANSPEQLWQLVAEGRDGLTELPADRGWDTDGLFDPDPDRPGTSYAREGGFLRGAADFDPGFFGISPREALGMDPQQRLLLETSWEAFERAGIDPHSLRGSDTGVFVGASGQDYSARIATVPANLDGYLVTGSAGSVMSGRLSYVYGLEGPAVTVDTACSSSLVALHLAVQALRKQECTLAVAAGATVMSTPGVFVEFSRQRGLATDGRCKAFADAADGTGWGEGVGVLVVERLVDARRNGHRVLALVRGSAVNQDGASNGLTAPNGPSQERVILQALAEAGLSTAEVDVVEGHGTGTTLGDPIEATALLATYGQGRDPGRPLRLGSVKSNIGHTQAAAGVAGVIKMVQAMRHETMPRTLHVDRPSDQVDWTKGAVSLLTEQEPWPRNGHPRRAGVSAFGVSGTNAHIILEQSEEDEKSVPEPVERPVAWVLSAASPAALTAQAARLAASVVDESPADVAYALVHDRAHLPHRAVVVGTDRADLVRGLENLTLTDVVTEGSLVFLFSGQGSQRLGMGHALYGVLPEFTRVFDEVCGHLDEHLPQPIRGVLAGDAVTLDQTVFAQSALFAVEVALYEQLRAWGLEPAFVAGHSIGEVAAAYAAGVLSLADACVLVAARGRLMQACPAGGVMLAVQATEAEVVPHLTDGVAVAAVNGPTSVVVSGDADGIAVIEEAFAERKTKRLRVSHAFHSPHMDGMLTEFGEVLAGLDFRPARIPVVSNLTGTTTERVSTPDYWVEHVRGTVRFADGVAWLAGQGVRTFVEVGPDGVLSAMVGETVADAVAVPALRSDRDEHQTLLTAVGRVHARGLSVDWDAVLGLAGARKVDLPTYAFSHERFWLDLPAGFVGDVASAGLGPAGHPLLGATVTLADGTTTVLTGRLSLRTHPWLADHAVGGSVLLPGTAFVELAVRAGDEVGCDRLDELMIQAPLVLTGSGAVQVQITVGAEGDDGRRDVAVHSRPEDIDAPWTQHAAGTLLPATSTPTGTLTEWPPDATAIPVEGLYDRLNSAGFGYGPVFQGLRAAWRAGDDLYAEVALPKTAEDDATRFGLHPALLDSLLHALGLSEWDGPGLRGVPFAWTGVRLVAAGATRVRARLTRLAAGGVSVLVTDQSGATVATIESLVLRPPATAAPKPSVPDALMRLDWTSLQVTPEPAEYPELATVRGEVPPVVVHRVSAVDGPVPEAVHEVTADVLDVVRTWLADERFAGSRLVVVTSGAVACDPAEDVPDLAAAAVWGLVRSAQSEHPDRFVLVDTDTPKWTDLLAGVLAAGESQFAVRDGKVYVPRLAKAGTGMLTPPDGPWRLAAGTNGTLDELVPRPAPEAEAPLEPGQVRIAVRAGGLNFRDVLIGLGMYPEQAMIGSEGAGVVTAVGSGVDGLVPGDRVMGLFPGAFGPVAVADHQMLAKLPDDWTYGTAASVPMVFLTAWYALTDLATLNPGQTVLVHSGAGGVGMAAIQIARHLGVRVLATASPGKWATLRDLGLADDEIASSRTLDFEAEFMALTGGKGVDLVLNSLAGDFVDASLRLLSPGGRFLEMGKTDVRDPAGLAGVSYQAFDLLEAGPARIGEMLAQLVELFGRGELRPLPVREWPMLRAADAFRHVSQAKHVGKNVLVLPGEWGSGTVLVTGATGGLGGQLARHLVTEHGVRHLVLASRSGHAPELAADLTDLGADVQVVACDVADRAALAATIDGIDQLTGVVHVAGVVDDGLVDTLTPDRLDTVARPKVSGAWHLHQLTGNVTNFVMFSSAAGTFGSPGQANYAAANTFLDALAQHRHYLGLPAVSLAWGPWAGQGMLADQDQRRVGRSALSALSATEGMALFDIACSVGDPVYVPAKLDLRGADVVPPLFRGLVRGPARRKVRDGAVDTESLGQRLIGLSTEDQQALLLDVVRAQVAGVLGHDGAEAVDPARTFSELGFDSLTAVELRNALGAATGERLPATLVFDYPRPLDLATYLRDQLGTAAGPVKAKTTSVSTDDDPIAVIAMSCRYPGGTSSPEQLWDLVASGGDAVGQMPADRGWDVDAFYDPDPDRLGTSYVREGGFLYDLADFDPGFFGISPREALAMDPQQRLLLETSWEAFERAGIDPSALRGSDTGVFAGTSGQDYGPLLTGIRQSVEGYLTTASSASVMAGRLSYTFGLQGPAVTVDTACSSSLVAVHLAVQALRQGECSLALAGGAAVFCSPMLFIAFSRQRGLAVDGRCKAFADAADGTGLGEGAGMLLLERLSDARRNGHQVLGLVRGSAVNQDGASNGLTAPNGPAQQRVIQQALRSAGLEPSDVDAVEAHGTGTRLGDPIEAQALLATYGQDRAEPLWLGSIKSNIGHAQAAAGVAGVIKMIMAMRHDTLPKTLHVDSPSSHVDWAAGAVRLLDEPVAWARNGRPRRAGVSSFGISGTNAHVVIEEAPPSEGVDKPRKPPAALPWLLSAKSDTALRALAEALADHPGDDLDVAYSLATTRTRLHHRAVVVGGDREQVRAGLRAVAAGEPAANVVLGHTEAPGKVVFVFPGQGPQWPGMARELLDSSPVFAARMAECEEVIGELVDWSVLDVIREAPDAPSMDRIEVLQPVLFAVMRSLAELWRSYGVQPAAVVGQSQGEIAAACVAGALSLSDAARIVVLRSQLFADELMGHGAVASVTSSHADVVARLEPYDEVLTIAGINGPQAVTVAGDVDVLTSFVAACQADGLRARVIASTVASHTPQVDRLRDRILAMFESVQPMPAQVPFYSTATGTLVDGLDLDADYWFVNARNPVNLVAAVRAMLDDGYGVFVESSSHPVLTTAVQDIADEAGRPAAVVGTLRRREGDLARFLLSLADAHVQGVAVAWEPLFDGTGARTVSLPTYPFQRTRFWPEATGFAADVSSAGLVAAEHPLLGAVTRLPDGAGAVLTGRLSLSTHAWLADHAVGGTVLVPATAFLELAVRAGDEVECARVEELTLLTPLAVPPSGGIRVQVSVGVADASGRRSVAVYSASEVDEWTQHAVGTLCPDSGDEPAPESVWPPRDAVSVPVSPFAYGPAFQGLRAVWRQGEETYAEVTLPDQLRNEAKAYGLHPALLATALQALPAGAADEVWMPFAWSGVRLYAMGSPVARVRLSPAADGGIGLTVLDQGGSVIASVESLVMRAVPAEQLRAARAVSGEVLRLEWTPIPAGEPRGGDWVVLADDPHLVAGLTGTSVRVGNADEVTGPQVVVSAEAELDAVVADERWANSRIVVLARHTSLDPAAVWGRVRSVQAEHPGRIVLVDIDESPASVVALTGLVDGDEPEVTLRDGVALVPRLVRTQPSTTDAPTGPILVTGDTDGLGDTLARHLPNAVIHTGDVENVEDTTLLVVCTSAKGLVGAPSADEYALRAMARSRHERGLPAVAVSWGGWGATLSEEDVLALFEAAVRTTGPELVLAKPTLAGITDVPPVLRGLVRPTRRVVNADEGAGGPSLSERLSGLDPVGRQEVLLDVVRTEAGAVLGHTSGDAVEPDRDFLELGFDSLTMVQLRNRVNTRTGLRLGVTVLFDRSSPVALARYLDGELADAAEPARPETFGPVGKDANAVAHLFLHGCAEGKFDEANSIAQAVSRLHPVFESIDDLPDRPRAIQLARGAALPKVVCVPSFSPASGPHEYAQLATHLKDLRDVSVLPLPGFVGGQPLPASLDALVRVLGAALLDHTGDEPYVLMGRSAAGMISHAVAGYLESIGRGPAAVLLLDTYFSQNMHPDVHDLVGSAMLGRETEATLLSDTRVIAMGGYQRIVTEWEPATLVAPTLLVRAREPFSAGLLDSGHDWRSVVDVPHSCIDVPGNHFTILEQDAATTALAVHDWLSDLGTGDNNQEV